MRNTVPDPPDPSPVSLTSTTRDGKPYRRKTEVEKQIAAALACDLRDWPSSDAAGRSRWRLETLIHLARQSASRNEHVFGQLLHELLQRAECVIRRWSKGFGPGDREEIDRIVVTKLVELVIIKTPNRRHSPC